MTASSMVYIINGLKMEILKNMVNIAMVNPMGFMKYGLKMGRSAKKVIGLNTVIIWFLTAVTKMGFKSSQKVKVVL